MRLQKKNETVTTLVTLYFHTSTYFSNHSVRPLIISGPIVACLYLTSFPKKSGKTRHLLFTEEIRPEIGVEEDATCRGATFRVPHGGGTWVTPREAHEVYRVAQVAG